MNDIDYVAILDKYEKSSGRQKFRHYIREIFESEYFLDFVKKIRKKYKIPVNGFSADEGIHFPPKQWELKNNKKMNELLNSEIRNLSKKYDIHFLDGSAIFEYYIFYNKTDYNGDFSGYGLFLVKDVLEEKVDPFSEETQDEDDRLYPIAIRISPNASLRDIIDFVKTSYKFPISQLQKKYKNKDIKLGKFKKRKSFIQERNAFIYKHRDLPKREISKLLMDKFGSDKAIDYGYIGKIISNEKKKRKKL